MIDDIIYFSTLILSIILGSYYKSIDNVEVKKQIGTGIGILIILLICGFNFFHMSLMVWVNCVILKACDKRYVHYASLTYTWLYLLFLHYTISHFYYVILLHKIVALRLVGMAFEINTADKQNSTPLPSVPVGKGETDNLLDPTSCDIVSYAFCFIGLHKGPYYRYRVYSQHLNGPFALLGDFRLLTEHKLKKALFCLIGYSLLRMKYSTQMYFDYNFYDIDTESRYLYNIPLLLMFFLKTVIVSLLCASVCTEAGFGVYPIKMMPMPGHGPSTRYSLLTMTQTEALQYEYNFSMLKSYNNEKLLFGPRMKDTIRCWDMPVRYWFWMNIYNKMFKARKEIRSACTFLAWALWTGPSVQTFIVASTLWVHVHLETEYTELYNTSGTMKLPWDIGFSIMRILCLIYLTPCFVLTDSSIIMLYYNSIFWVLHGVLLVLIVGAFVTFKSRSYFATTIV